MMRRSIIALLLGGLIAALAGADQSPTKAQAAFDRLREELLRETFEVRSVEAAKAVFAKYTKKFFEHAKDHPKDASAAEALMYVVAMLNPDDADKDGPRARALAALRKDHLKAPTIRGQLGQMAMSAVLGRGPALANAKEDLVEVVREVAEVHPDRRTRALACRALLASRQVFISLTLPVTLDEKEFFKKCGEKLEDRWGGAQGLKKVREKRKAAAKEAARLRAELRGDLKGALADVSVGAKAPALEAVDLKGNKVRLSDLKGKVVLLEFWTAGLANDDAVEAGSAVAESMRELAKEMKGRPFAVVSVSADANKEAPRKFLDKVSKPWAQWWVGHRARQLEDWGVFVLRTTYLIDHKGVIRDIRTPFANPIPPPEEVEKLVKAAEAEKKP
jgi:peroxiredoxin